MLPNIKDKFKEVKERTLKLALLPVGFVSYHFFGKKLIFNRFTIKQTDDFFCQEIAKNIEISSEWLKFSLEPPIKVRKTHPCIQVFIEGYEMHYLNYLTKTNKFKDTAFFYKPILPDGTIINPKVQLIDEYEKTHDLEFMWYDYCVGFTKELPRDRKYTELKVYSDVPFKSYLIRWFDWESKDEK